ncbi:hypothetical protein AN4354.2 [Aspergillus nidulans FGSC A4]|nr:hypothetical protein AN4354.2 [Aspergillus nidulans FGSC A4]|eukprot:XP_661958.1 hypothetical protein AN4354.2 [Aspergillus nidulans FGSC A4]
MKLSLAVALPLALVAVAAPTPLKLKRDDGDSPSADVASKIAYGSLKSAAQMMDLYSVEEDDKDEAKARGNANTNVPDYGNNMPINMTPNTVATFPGADGKPASGAETKGNQHSAPTGAEKEHAAASPSVSAAATPSSAGPSFTAGKPSAGEGEHVENKQEQGSTPAASPSPSASAPAAPKKQSMLENLPLVGGLGGIVGGLGSGLRLSTSWCNPNANVCLQFSVQTVS